MRSSRDFRDVAQKRYILSGSIKLVGGNQRGNRLSTRGVILINIGMLIQSALDNFRAVFEVLSQVFFDISSSSTFTF